MSGVCRLGDRAKAPIDNHGCVGCPHPNVTGPAISGSSNVNINGRPALRILDIGMHMACCGTNMWSITQASGQVFVNNSRIVRRGDSTQHCGGKGQMIEASGNVIDNSPIFHEPMPGSPNAPPLPLNQVLVFPKFEPFCDANAPPGLPTFGNPQVYDETAEILKHLSDPPRPRRPLSKEEEQWQKEEQRRMENTSHVSAAPSSLYDDVDGAKAAVEFAKAELESIKVGSEGWKEARGRAQEAYNRALTAYQLAQANSEQEELDKETAEADGNAEEALRDGG
jgi:uncharacterized Zn-binding protein involved in type VI secretion